MKLLFKCLKINTIPHSMLLQIMSVVADIIIIQIMSVIAADIIMSVVADIITILTYNYHTNNVCYCRYKLCLLS